MSSLCQRTYLHDLFMDAFEINMAHLEYEKVFVYVSILLLHYFYSNHAFDSGLKPRSSTGPYLRGLYLCTTSVLVFQVFDEYFLSHLGITKSFIDFSFELFSCLVLCYLHLNFTLFLFISFIQFDREYWKSSVNLQ
jgi:hypothetical protein